jgi:hypothetical protein
VDTFSWVLRTSEKKSRAPLLLLTSSSLSVISIQDWWSVVPDICFSTFPLAFFFIFGSQRDILRLWRRWFLPCTISTEQETQRTTHRQPTTLDSAEIDKWRVSRKEGDPEVTEVNESWQELEDARYYECHMQWEENGGAPNTDHQVLTGRAVRGTTRREEEEDADLDLRYVHTRSSSNEADPEGNPFSSASTVFRFSPPPAALTLSRERSQRGLTLSRAHGGVMARPTSVVDEYNPTFRLHDIQPPPPSPSIFQQSPPGTPTLVASPPPPPPTSPRSPSRQPFRPNLWSRGERDEPFNNSSTSRVSQIGMAL